MPENAGSRPVEAGRGRAREPGGRALPRAGAGRPRRAAGPARPPGQGPSRRARSRSSTSTRGWTPSTSALTAGRPWDLVLDVAGRQGHRQAVAGAAAPRTTRRRARRPAPGLRPATGGLGGRRGRRAAGRAPSLRRRGATSATTPSATWPPSPPRRPTCASVTAGCARRARSTPWPRCPSADGDAFLRARPSAGRTLTTVPGLRFASRCALRSSGPVDLPSEYDAPAVSLREYGDVTCLGRQAAYGDGFVLPESYRHPFKRRLRNVAFAEWAPRFVRRPEPATAAPRRPGVPARHLRPRPLRPRADRPARPPVGLARRARPAPRPARAGVRQARRGRSRAGSGSCSRPAASTARPRRGRARADARRGAGGVVADVRDARLRAPRDRHDVRRGGRRPGVALDARRPRRAYPARCGCSAPGGRASAPATTPAEVEGLFAAHGFAVVYPEDHPLPEQARMVRDADVVAGFAGSGMFQIAFAGGPKHVILVGSESYTASNEYLISSVRRAPARPGALPPGRAAGGAGVLQRVVPVRLHLRRRPGRHVPPRGPGRPVRPPGTSGDNPRLPPYVADATQHPHPPVRRRACAASAARSCCR